MISKALSQVFNLQTKRLTFRMGASFNEGVISEVRNSNLEFDSDRYAIKMYTFYPKVFRKENENAYIVSHETPVLAFSFLDKNLVTFLLSKQSSESWENRKSFSFDFKSMGHLLHIEMDSGRSIELESAYSHSKSPKKKVLTVKDLSSNLISMKLKQISAEKESFSRALHPSENWEIEAIIPYSEYSIIYTLIESCITDLSGWKFMLELEKRRIMTAFEAGLGSTDEMDELLKN